MGKGIFCARDLLERPEAGQQFADVVLNWPSFGFGQQQESLQCLSWKAEIARTFPLGILGKERAAFAYSSTIDEVHFALFLFLP
jgi:hypothetical protein